MAKHPPVKGGKAKLARLDHSKIMTLSVATVIISLEFLLDKNGRVQTAQYQTSLGAKKGFRCNRNSEARHPISLPC